MKKNKKLRVWWTPQVGVGIPLFYKNVDTLKEGVMLVEALVDYDRYEYDNNIKNDYSNAGGIEQFGHKGWEGWDIEDKELGYFYDPEEYMKAKGLL